MDIVNLIPEEVEQERAEQAQQLAADSGASWADEYQPGSAGCHELLDRAAIFAAMLEGHLRTHPACIANEEWFLLAAQASAALHELYQQIGAVHLAAAPNGQLPRGG